MTEIVASKHRVLLFQSCISVSTVIVFHGVARARRVSWPGVSGSIMFSLNVIGVCGSLTTNKCILSSRIAISRLVGLSFCISVCCWCFRVYLDGCVYFLRSYPKTKFDTSFRLPPSEDLCMCLDPTFCHSLHTPCSCSAQ